MYDYAGTHYASIVVQVTSYDFRCTSGLCGTFDEDQRNDMKDLSGKIHDFMQRMPASALFTETYRYVRSSLSIGGTYLCAIYHKLNITSTRISVF